MDIQTSRNLYIKLQKQVEIAQKLNQPIDNLVKQQIQLLEKVHDEFVSSTLAKNKDLEFNLDFAGTRIKQLQAIASLCKKIGLPTDKYENQIREIRIQTLGVDFVKKHYD